MTGRRSGRTVLLACLASALLLAQTAGAASSRTTAGGAGDVTGPSGSDLGAALPSACGPGHAWIGGASGLTCLDADGWTLYGVKSGSFPGGSVSDVAVCRDGTSWLVTSTELISAKGRSWQSHPAMKYKGNGALTCGAKTGVWVVGYKYLYFYDGKKVKSYPASKLGTGEFVNLVKDVAVAPDGHVWVVTTSSVATFDGSRWTYFEEGKGFDTKYYFEKVVVDVQGRVWVAAGTEGLLMYDGTTWTAFDEPFLSMSQALAVDARGRLWAGSYSHGVSVFDGEGWTTYDRTNSSLPADAVKSLAIDTAGRIWVGTEWGLAVLDDTEWTVYHMFDANISDNEIKALAVAGKGPVLPTPVTKKPGTLKGRIVKSGTAQVDVAVEICVGSLGMMYFGSTPCSSQPFLMTTKTDPDGRFAFTRVPAGWYCVTFQPPGGEWMTLSTAYGFGSSHTLVGVGKTADLGTIDLAKGK